MAGFTGILGSAAAQLGDIILGVGPAGGVTVVNTVTVSDQVAFVVDQGKWKRLTDTVTVSTSTTHHSDINRSLSDSITTSQTILAVPSPYLRVTQTVVEVAYAGRPTTHISQMVVEVLYRRDTRQSVTSNVHVTSTINNPKTYSKTVTSTATVAQTIGYRDTNNRQSVTNSVVVAQVIGQHGPVPASLTHAITVGQTIALHDTGVPITVTSPVAVTSSIAIVGIHNLSVANAVTVAQTIGKRVNPNRQSVTDTLSVTPGLGFSGISDFITSRDTITVGQTIGVRSNIVRITVTDHIGVSSNPTPNNATYHLTVIDSIGVSHTPACRNTNVRITVTDTIHTDTPTGERDVQNRQAFISSIIVNQSIQAGTNHPHLFVTDSIHVTSSISPTSNRVNLTDHVAVTQTINQRNTRVRLAVSNSVMVTSTPYGRPNPLPISVSDTVQTHVDGFWGPVARVNPNKQSVYDFVTVGETYYGIGSQPAFTVSDSISVGESYGHNQLFFVVHDQIGVSSTVIGGNSNRTITVSDFATLSDSATARNAIVRGVFQDRIVVRDRIGAQGPIVLMSVADAVHITPTITPRMIPHQSLSDRVNVGQSIHFAGATRQSVHDTLGVAQTIRSSPVVQSVLDTIHVTQSPKLAEITIHQIVHVNSQVHMSVVKHVNQSLNFTQQVIAQRVFIREIKQSLGLTDTLNRGMTYKRTVNQQLVFPDKDFTKPISLPPGQIIVPVAAGTIVDPIVTLQSAAGVIVLPRPEFDDAQGNVNEMKVKRTMTGLTYTFVKSTDRRNLNYKFKIPTLKALELRAWIIGSMSLPITMTNWKGETWIVFLASNPFAPADMARWGTHVERVEVELELEGVKISG